MFASRSSLLVRHSFQHCGAHCILHYYLRPQAVLGIPESCAVRFPALKFIHTGQHTRLDPDHSINLNPFPWTWERDCFRALIIALSFESSRKFSFSYARLWENRKCEFSAHRDQQATVHDNEVSANRSCQVGCLDRFWIKWTRHAWFYNGNIISYY